MQWSTHAAEASSPDSSPSLERLIDSVPPLLASYVAPIGSTRAKIAEDFAFVRERFVPSDWRALLSHMSTLGDDFTFYRRNPLASEIAHSYMKTLILPESTLGGLEHLDHALDLVAQGRRLMIVGNHLSYADTMALCSLLRRANRADAAERVVAVAGPKVYSDAMRRLAVAGIHSIKVAQSSRLQTNDVELSPREIARITRSAMNQAAQSMDDGQIVLIYPEGTRSRNGRLQPFMRATSRWLSIPGTVLLPFGVWGLDNLYALDEGKMRPATCHGRFGSAICSESIRAQGDGRDELLRRAHQGVAALLPAGYGPEPGCAPYV